MKAEEKIVEEVSGWPDVTLVPHRFGGVEFRCRGTEIGHLHGDVLCDVLLPKSWRDEYIASGMAKPHHIYPESNWVSIFLKSDQDIANAISILRRKYLHLIEGPVIEGPG